MALVCVPLDAIQQARDGRKETANISVRNRACSTAEDRGKLRLQRQVSHVLERRVGGGVVVQLGREDLHFCPSAKEIAPVAVYALLREVMRPELLSAG